MPGALSAGTVSLGVKADTTGFGAKLASDIKGQGSHLAGAGKAIGLSLLGGVGLAMAGVGMVLKTGFDEAKDASAGVAQLTAGIKSTGNAAGVSVKGMTDLAGSIQGMSGQTDDSIVASEQLLLTFCLEESAQALAKGRGWVNHDQLNAGDEILAYDPVDDTARWEPVESMHRFDVNGDLIRWKSKQIDVATTPHHKWWTVGSHAGSKYEPQFRTTEEISGHQISVKIGGGQPEGFAGEATYSDDLVELAGWVMTEGWFVPWKDQSGVAAQQRRNRLGLPEVRLCAACDTQPARNKRGPAVCDDCALVPIKSGRTNPAVKVTAETSRRSGVGFCQSLTANPLEVKRIRLLVDRLRSQGHRISETSYVAPYNGSTVVEWHFARDLGTTVRAMVPEKKLTVDLIESLTTDQARLLFDVLIAADGYVDIHGHEQFIQKDAGQLDVVAILAAMLGRRTTVLGRGDSIYFPETNNLKGSAVHAQPEHYEGVVWCPHLRTGIFLARNNGRTFWTGNTNIRNNTPDKIFDQATLASANMAAKMGGDASSMAIKLGKALNDPTKGVTALTKVGVSFTDGQKASIKAMQAHGDMAGAQKIILGELTKEFGGAAEAAGKSLPGQLAIGKRAFEDLSQSVVTALLPAFTTALTGINNFVKDAGTAFNKGGLSGVFTMVKDKISAALPGIQAKLAEWGTALWTWIQVALPPMLMHLGELYVQLQTWIYTVALPKIVTTLQEWAKAFWAWIGPMIPPFLAKIGELLTALGTWLTGTALPAIALKLGEWANAFVKWIGPMIPPFLVKIGTLLGAFGTWFISTALPWLVSHLAQWASAFIKWIAPMIPPFIVAIGGLLAKLVWWIVSEALPSIISHVAGWIGAFLGWIAGAVAQLPGKLVGLAAVILTWAAGIPAQIVSKLGDLVKLLVQKGKDIIQGLFDGMKAVWTTITEWVGSIATWIKDHKGPLSLDRTLLTPAGTAIMEGFHQGLKDGFVQVQASMTAMTGSIAGGASQWIPTIQRVLTELGQPLTLTAAVTRLIMKESGGNPNAINLTDSNAAAGHPSQGLIQTIPSTFAAYAGPYASLGITNPLANIYAGLSYALSRYGSIAAVDPLVHAGGYDEGGMLMPGGLGKNYGTRPERVLSGAQTASFDRLVASLDRSGGSSDLLAELVGLRADIRALPRAYQLGMRTMVGAR